MLAACRAANSDPNHDRRSHSPNHCSHTQSCHHDCCPTNLTSPVEPNPRIHPKCWRIPIPRPGLSFPAIRPRAAGYCTSTTSSYLGRHPRFHLACPRLDWHPRRQMTGLQRTQQTSHCCCPGLRSAAAALLVLGLCPLLRASRLSEAVCFGFSSLTLLLLLHSAHLHLHHQKQHQKRH